MLSVFIKRFSRGQCDLYQHGCLSGEADLAQSMIVIRPYSGKDTLEALNFDQIIRKTFLMPKPYWWHFSP